MKILILNPNTSTNMTNDINNTILKIKRENINVIVKNPDFGPESLESYYDYSLATIGSIREVNKHSNIDGLLLACFGDPGIYTFKEKYDFPTIGIAEASMSKALLLGKKFSLLVASEKAISMMEDMVYQYGLEKRLSSIETIKMNVLDIEEDYDNSLNKLKDVGREAISKGAEVLILACAGMTSFRKDLQGLLNIPVIDPVMVGYKALESILEMDLSISNIGLFKEPYPKKIKNEEYLKLEL